MLVCVHVVEVGCGSLKGSSTALIQAHSFVWLLVFSSFFVNVPIGVFSPHRNWHIGGKNLV